MTSKTPGSTFTALCLAQGLPEPVAEFRFCPARKWRADWHFPPRILLEIEGGIWTGGRHTRGKGYSRDLEKYNEAALLGYTVLRVTPEQVNDGTAFALVKRAIDAAERGEPE